MEKQQGQAQAAGTAGRSAKRAQPPQGAQPAGMHEAELFAVPGVAAAAVWLAVSGFGLWLFFSWAAEPASAAKLALAGLCGLAAALSMGGFTVLQPNVALAATFFGSYAGSLKEDGFFWINPFYSCQRITLKALNGVTPVLKVNDGRGNPIEIAAAYVWRVNRPASALFDVQDLEGFVRVQAESALRALASAHPYDDAGEGQGGAPSLSRHAQEVVAELAQALQARLGRAGVVVDEARFTHLAYAPEIAQAMLRKQQAQSVVAARETIVEGAVGMVEKAIKSLEQRGVVKLSDPQRAALVTNMLTVLLSEEGAKPVVSVASSQE